MTKSKELRDQTVEELVAALNDKSKELFVLRNEFKHSKKAEKPHRIREMRRDKARILTVLAEKRTAK